MSDSKYIQVTKSFIKDALHLISQGANEFRIRENFTSYLRLMFPPSTRWIDRHIQQGETAVRLNRKGRAVKGFIDNCIDKIVIEYEKNLKNRTIFEEGFRQVKEYTAALVNKGEDKEIVVGILSDTINWFVYEVKGPNLDKGRYTEDNIILQLIDEHHVNEADDLSAERLLKFLQKNLGKIGGRQLTAEALSMDFGIDSKYTKQYVANIKEYVADSIAKNRDYYSLIEDLWRSFVDVEASHNSSVKTDAIQHTYSLELYISIIAKLLAANILKHTALLSDDNELKEIISGIHFENQGIFNFAEYDYFGWLSRDNITCIIPTLKSIQRDLSVYDYSTVKSGDLFGSLLVQLANKHHRLLLGQELTPFWLSTKMANHAMNLLPDDQLPRFVDMCCGSGSMLTATINVTKRAFSYLSEEELESAVLSCVTGFDIDPLATILAKINWIINVADIVDFAKGIYIPVYHSDSLFLSSLANFTSDENVTINLFDKIIGIPKYLLSGETQILFDTIVNKCHDLIGVEINKNVLDSYIDSIWDQSYDSVKLDTVKEAAFNLYKAMYSLNKEGKNGIWSFVIKNSLRPSLIRADFNGIISNTPWLAMSKIANNPYKDSLRDLARRYNLLPTGASAHHLELATIFLISSVDRYLQPGGIFGCILPHSVINGNHHLALRLGKFQDAENQVDADFSDIWLLEESVFKNKAIVLFGQKCRFSEKNSIPGNFISASETKETTFKIITSGNMTIWTNEEVRIERIEFDYYKFTQGADIMPRALFFFNLEKKGQFYRISQINHSSKYAFFLGNLKSAKDFSPAHIAVDIKYFMPILLSHCLNPFKVDNFPLALLPIKRDESERWIEIDQQQKMTLPRQLIHHFSSIQRRFQEEKNESDLFTSGLNMRNKLTDQEFHVGQIIVVYGAGGSRICAAYFKIDNARRDLIIDQTIYYYLADSEEEAQFLTGMLNSTAVAEANAAYQSQGKLGRRHIHTLPSSSIPQFNPNDDLHQAMVLAYSKVKSAIEERIPSGLFDPNFGSVHMRRSRIYKYIDKMDEYQKMNDIAYHILEGHH